MNVEAPGSVAPETAVITLVRGRSGHLRRQIDGLRIGSSPVDLYVAVALDDPEVRGVVASAALPSLVIDVPMDAPAPAPVQTPDLAPVEAPVEATVDATGDLPLAAARNAGARAAITAGARILIFLDVDCIPGPHLVARYRDAARDPRHASDLLCGPVAYLPPPGASGYDLHALAELAAPHPARPVPGDGEVVVAENRRLFWSLSFALTTATWLRIGGFCESYRGYGAEDTDFAELAATAGIGMRWVGGATAFHQHHPVSAPPVEHVTSIVRNARIFRDRWGWWPMEGWLRQFAELGLAQYDANLGWTIGEPRPVVTG